jgi:dTDP-4-dehydrorhamnose 3,5-epimerase
VIISDTEIPGAKLIRPQTIADERGYFARTFSIEEFQAHGLDTAVVQRSLSFNLRRGTLRGMHFQLAPHDENKLVSCSRGSIFDVAVDLRRDSPTFRRWISTQLTADGLEAFYIPKGCAHGFITLEDHTTVRYDISASTYTPEAARGYRFDDPAFGIEWPFDPVVINGRDAAWPSFGDAEPRPPG